MAAHESARRAPGAESVHRYSAVSPSSIAPSRRRLPPYARQLSRVGDVTLATGPAAWAYARGVQHYRAVVVLPPGDHPAVYSWTWAHRVAILIAPIATITREGPWIIPRLDAGAVDAGVIDDLAAELVRAGANPVLVLGTKRKYAVAA